MYRRTGKSQRKLCDYMTKNEKGTLEIWQPEVGGGVSEGGI